MSSPYPHDTGRIHANVSIAKAIEAKTYLEIGCQGDHVFKAMEVAVKVGVDPVVGGNVKMTSDAFFDVLRRSAGSEINMVLPETFDLIFIDGDHMHPQVAKDVINALEFLAPGGVITMHDVYPPDAKHEGSHLCGTAWRAFVREARMRADVEAYVSDVDTYGLGVLRKRPNTALLAGELVPAYGEMTYEMMVRQVEWMRRKPHAEVLSLLGI